MSGVGLGDHIASLPVITELRKRWELVVYSHSLAGPLYERLGIEWHDESEIHFDWKGIHKPEYGKCFSMRNWSQEEQVMTHGNPVTRFVDLFASHFGMKAPSHFNYKAFLAPQSDKHSGRVCFFPRASVAAYMAWNHRSIPNEIEIRDELSKHYTVDMLGTPNGAYCGSIQEIIDTVWQSEGALTCDTGLAHIAFALGVPTMAVFGMSEPETIYGQYEDYTGGKKLYKMLKGCDGPCYGCSEKGITIDGKCLDRADCMADINAEDLVYEFNHFIRSN